MTAALLATLHTAGRQHFASYRPQPVIDAVNALWALGRTAALAALEAHLAQHDLQADPHEGLLLVLRVLFEVPTPPGHQPVLQLGSTTPPPPPDPGTLPHFPLLLVDDRPLLLVTGAALGGDVEPVTTALQHYRATGRLRLHALAPAQSAGRALALLRTLYARAYGAPPPAAVLAHVQRQLRRG